MANFNPMKKLNFSALTRFPVLIGALLMIASCARSPYNFVRVQPKPFDKVATASRSQAYTPVRTMPTSSGAVLSFKAPSLDGKASSVSTRKSQAEMFGARRGTTTRETRKSRREATGKVVERELQKSSAFSALPTKKFEKVKKIITRKAERLSEKKAAAAASPVGFNQWMKIGVILLLIGLVVGIAFADLGYIVAVIGVVFLVLGLIQQL